MTLAPPVTDCVGVPSPQSIAYVNPAALSAVDGSVAPNVTSPGVAVTIPVGTSMTEAVGATLVIVRWRRRSVWPPSVTCHRHGERTGRGRRRDRARRAQRRSTVGVTPVASSNWPSLSRSQAKSRRRRPARPAAVQGQCVALGNRVGPAGVGATKGRTVTGAVAGGLVPASLSVAVTLTVNVPSTAQVCVHRHSGPAGHGLNRRAVTPVDRVGEPGGGIGGGRISRIERDGQRRPLRRHTAGTVTTAAVGGTLAILSVRRVRRDRRQP